MVKVDSSKREQRASSEPRTEVARLARKDVGPKGRWSGRTSKLIFFRIQDQSSDSAGTPPPRPAPSDAIV